ncbi:MAG: peptidylprolyl isomerase [Ruminococcus sp.]|nr:peptidylprolyl isomerase [Ruminococcus sp.]
MIKKISAALIALTMSVCMFTSCGKSSSSDADSSSSSSSSTADSSSSGDASSGEESSSKSDSSSQVEGSLTIDGKKQDISNFVMCTIDGTDIDFMTFRYFYFYTIEVFKNDYGADLNTIVNAKGGFEDLLKQTIENIKSNRIIVDKLVKENNITLTDDDKKKIEEEYENTKKQFKTEDEFKAQMKNAHLTDELYRKNLEYKTLTEKISNTLFTNDGKYATKRADFKNIAKDTSKFASELHIMIPYYSEAELDEETKKTYDSMTLDNKAQAKNKAYTALDAESQKKVQQAAKAKADEALKKALAGEDFKKLMTEYSWDNALAQKEVGYFFSPDNTDFPKEIVEKTYTLKENEVAKDLVVHELYGYFIVKRIPVDMTYVEKNIDAIIADYDKPRIQKLISEWGENMKVTYCDGWDKLNPDSVQ